MNQRGNVWVILLAIVASFSLAGAAYFYGLNQNLIKGLDYKGGTTTAEATGTPTSYESFNSPTYASPMVSPTATAKSGATVVYEAEGSFTLAEKNELTKKVVNPFVDYYKMETQQVLLTLTLSKNDKSSKETYPYQVQAVFQGGATSGFLVMKEGTGVAWWFPECMNGCNLSAAYKLKYPEISAKVQ